MENDGKAHGVLLMNSNAMGKYKNKASPVKEKWRPHDNCDVRYVNDMISNNEKCQPVTVHCYLGSDEIDFALLPAQIRQATFQWRKTVLHIVCHMTTTKSLFTGPLCSLQSPSNKNKNRGDLLTASTRAQGVGVAKNRCFRKERKKNKTKSVYTG